MPDKSQESSVVFGEVVLERLPFDIHDWYTDRGTEWKGTKDHEFVHFLSELGITQHFTKPRTPQTNGKAERVIRTLMEEWHRKHVFTSRTDRRQRLYQFVDFFNHERTHGTYWINTDGAPSGVCEADGEWGQRGINLQFKTKLTQKVQLLI